MIVACSDSNLWSAVGMVLGAGIAYMGFMIGRKS